LAGKRGRTGKRARTASMMLEDFEIPGIQEIQGSQADLILFS
jgi:hypothetical protein